MRYLVLGFAWLNLGEFVIPMVECLLLVIYTQYWLLFALICFANMRNRQSISALWSRWSKYTSTLKILTDHTLGKEFFVL